MKPSEAIREIAGRRAVDMGNGEKVFSVHPEDILEWLDTHAGSGEVERIADSNESFLIGYAAGKRHAGGVPSAVEVTVEEWEALEDCVSTDRGQYDANTRLLAGKALRKLNARAALSKSETTQPATGDGAGAARMFQLWAEGYGNEQTWGGLANNERAVWTEAFEFARELGAKEAQPHRIAVRVLRERASLKEKLAAAEANSERWAKETLELQELVERNAERAEKAEARVINLNLRVQELRAGVDSMGRGGVTREGRAREILTHDDEIKAMHDEHRPGVKP